MQKTQMVFAEKGFSDFKIGLRYMDEGSITHKGLRVSQ
jgi:hypothetical protein